MIKKLLYLIAISLIFTSLPTHAEKISVKISPAQIISTHHDEIEIGDNIKFEVAKDVLFQDKILISKGTPIFGTVDYMHENGWGSDPAEIVINKFYTKDTSGNKIEIDSKLDINGNSELSDKSKDLTINTITQVTALYLGRIIRGSEIFIQPDEKIFNIFIEK